MDDYTPGNRDKKVEGRRKRRRYVQGTAAFAQALTNSIVRRGRRRHKK